MLTLLKRQANWIMPEEFAARIGVSEKKVYRWMKRPENSLPFRYRVEGGHKKIEIHLPTGLKWHEQYAGQADKVGHSGVNRAAIRKWVQSHKSELALALTWILILTFIPTLLVNYSRALKLATTLAAENATQREAIYELLDIRSRNQNLINMDAALAAAEELQRQNPNMAVLQLKLFELIDQVERQAAETQAAARMDRATLKDWLVRAEAIPRGWPTNPTVTTLTSLFGDRYAERSSLLSRVMGITGWHFHSGIDIAGPLGTPIYATAPGVVVAAEERWNWGLMVVIDHGWGYVTYYGHMDRIDVAANDWVERGDQIGAMGSTGTSIGSHLHYEVHLNRRPVDPINYVRGEDPNRGCFE